MLVADYVATGAAASLGIVYLPRFREIFETLESKPMKSLDFFLELPATLYFVAGVLLVFFLLSKEVFLKSKKATVGINVVVGMSLLGFMSLLLFLIRIQMRSF